MKTFLFRLWQWTWGFPQTLLGAILYLIHTGTPRSRFHGCAVTHWDQRGSMSMGMFLFLGDTQDPRVAVHEFGHSVQSAILGPLFLPLIGLPSYLWCNLPVCRTLRQERSISYYWLYCESEANLLGAWAAGTTCDLK